MRRSAMGLCALAVLMLLPAGCGDKSSGSDNDRDTGDDSSHGEDTADSDTGSDTDSEGPETSDDSDDPDTNSDMEDDNTPPNLPAACRLVTETVGGQEVGDLEVTGRGDGRDPVMEMNLETGNGVIAWRYFAEQGSGQAVSRWGIQSAPYVVEHLEDGEYTRELGETNSVTTAEESHLAESPALAKSDDGYLVVFRDARWDTDCNPSDYDACHRDLALLRLDETGTPLDRDPIRLTETGTVTQRPDIARTPDGGYIVTWIEPETDGFHVRAVRLDASGSPGEIFTLPDRADEYDGPSVASNDNVAVIVYATEHKAAIVVNVWPHDASAPGETSEIISEAHTSQRSPRVAAGDEGFMVSWSGQYATQYEVFLHPLDAMGGLTGEMQRGTWCYDAVVGSDVAWNGETFALVYEAPKVNGVGECAVEASQCNSQVFAALVNEAGEVTTEAVMYSSDPNQSQSSRIVWDGIGWTVVWKTWGNLRWRVFYGQMVCD